MPETNVEALIEGGKASAAPPLGPQLGPLGVNIGEVINKINQKTQDFKGMKVPVKIKVKDDKSFDIEIGTPPVSQLIQKELEIEKGSGMPNKQKVGNLAIEQTIKIAKMKQSSMFVNDLKSAIKSIAGSANAMGVLIEGKTSVEFNNDLNAGIFDNEIRSGKTELSPDKKQFLKEQLDEVQKRLQKEMERLKALEEAEKAVEAKKPEAEQEKKEEPKAEAKEEKELKKEEKQKKEDKK